MLAEWQTYSRTAPGMQAAPANLSGVRQMLRALRKGETVGLLPDQVPPDGQGVWVPYFGRTAYTMTLAARLAQQTGCAVVLTWCERLPRGRGFAIHYRPLPQPLPDSGEESAALVNQAMEWVIAHCPDQYLWGYNRYKQPRRGSRRRRSQSMIKRWGSQAIVFLMWLLHWLPLPLLAAIGEGVGALLWRLAGSRRKVVLKNLALCFPELDEAARRRLAREHFGAVARGFLEHSYLWFASEERLLRMVRIEGDIHLAERTGHVAAAAFVGLDYTAPALMLKQSKPAITIYQRQSNAVFDEALLKARARFGQARLFDRQAGIRPVLRAIQKEGAGFVNLPDMDFGTKDAAFVPFFGVPAATLLAPARMAQSMHMLVQPIVVTMLPRGQGYVVRFCEAPEGFDNPDLPQAAAAFNRWLEARIREQPAQYYWVHRRFKTRPEGEAKIY
jgi:KDO2-lipid IV(A) lauroyltransferase